MTLLCLLSLPGGASALPSEKEKWIRVRTDNFVLVGNTSSRQLRNVGVRLERFRAALPAAHQSNSAPASEATTVVVFRDEHSFEPYKLRTDGKPANNAGSFHEGIDCNYIGLNGESSRSSHDIVYHEYVHYFLSRRYGPLPLWLNEGLAEYWSTFESNDDRIEVGLPIAHHVRLLASVPLMHLADLFAMNTSSKDYREGERQGLFYAESWAFVHYTLRGDPTLQPKLQRFVELISGSHTPNQAFPVAFGMEYGEFEAALREYVVADKFPYQEISVADWATLTACEGETLSRAELLYVLGDYLAHMTPWRTQDIEEHLREALRLAPDHARAHSALAGLLQKQNKPEEAEKHFQQAIDLGRDDDLPFFLYGMSKLEHFAATHRKMPLRPSALPVELLAARGLLSRCLEMDPSRAQAYVGLGRTYLYDPEDTGTGIEALLQAYARLPARWEIPYYLIVLYLREGDRRSAEDIANRVLLHTEDPKIVEQTRDLLEWADLRDAVDKYRAGDYDTAITILERLEKTARDPDLVAQARNRLKRVRQMTGKR